MSTRSYISKQMGANQFKTIYCHCDGYLEHNGRILLQHYNTPERVDALLALGDISSLREKTDPDPSRPHRFYYADQQEDVTVAYGRDRGDQGTEAEIMTLEQLDDPGNWTEYVYIYTPENAWKYFEAGQSQQGLRSVAEDLVQLKGQVQKAPAL